MVIKKCVVCGKEFDARGRAKTCGKECSKKNNKRRWKQYGRQYRQKKTGKQYDKIKKCIICGKEFNARTSAKTCSKECSERRIKERLKQYSRQYYQDNKEHIKQYKKQYRQDNKEYFQQYRQDNKEHLQQYNRQWRQDNKERLKQYRKQYYQDNKEHFQQYRQDNREKYQRYDAQRCKREVNELKKQYDGDLDKILENIPLRWYLREAQMQVWFNESYYDGIIAKIESTPCCEVTGETSNLVIHHLYSFSTHSELGNDPANMVRITEDVHKAFHKEYGYGNNTPQQWKEFVSNYLHN